jgi:hypothetical protein
LRDEGDIGASRRLPQPIARQTNRKKIALPNS